MRIRTSLAILAAAGLAAAPAADAATVVRSFHTPSGNIGCTISNIGGWRARCDVSPHSWRPPRRPASCDFDWGDAIQMGRKNRPSFRCVSDAAGGGRKLAYGTKIVVGPFTCRSTTAFLRCVNAGGHGWKLSKQSRTFF